MVDINRFCHQGSELDRQVETQQCHSTPICPFGTYGRLYFVPYNKIYSKTKTCKLFCSLVRPSFVRRVFFVDAKIFRRRQNFRKTNLGRHDGFGKKIVGIGAILAIFEPFEVRRIRMPLFGEFSRSSQDLYRNPL